MAEVRPPSHLDDPPTRVVAKRIDEPQLDDRVLSAAMTSERGRALAGAERIGTMWSPSRTSDRRFIVVFRCEGREVDVEIVDGAIVDVRERKGGR